MNCVNIYGLVQLIQRFSYATKHLLIFLEPKNKTFGVTYTITRFDSAHYPAACGHKVLKSTLPVTHFGGM